MAARAGIRYKLIFFTPPTSIAAVKSVIFATGAGTIGKYTQCCFTTPGIGQFKPGEDAKPHIGDADGKVEEVGEVKCEIMCTGKEQAVDAVAALKSAHPYEEVAYEVYKVEDL